MSNFDTGSELKTGEAYRVDSDGVISHTVFRVYPDGTLALQDKQGTWRIVEKYTSHPSCLPTLIKWGPIKLADVRFINSISISTTKTSQSSTLTDINPPDTFRNLEA